MKKLKKHLIELFFTVEFLRYFVSGLVATAVNVLVYMLMSRWLGLDRWYYSDVPAIFLSVLAAYVLNRLWVFHSESDVWLEFIRFVGSRLAISFVFEYVGIYLVRHILGNTTEIIPGTLDLGKLIALVFVVLANRISGKLYVFKEEDKENPMPHHTQAVDPQFYLDRAMAAIRKADAFGNNLLRDRSAGLYRELGDPWRSYPAFHIAGTNGKGSISAYLTHILCHSGLKVGWYTSPFLERFNERIRVLDGQEGLLAFDRDFMAGQIPDADIARLMEKIEAAAGKVVSAGGAPPTQFDLMTALAFLWFEEEACDVAVLETGMGGRFDSTNILEQPLACLIGAPGFDHMDRLGNTMREIMGEKAGILKEGCPVFAYAPEDALLSDADARDARDVLESRCRELSAPLEYFGYSDFTLLDYGWTGQRFQVKGDGRVYSTRLIGPYQPIYALMAGAAAQSAGMADQASVERGIADCIWPARMEILADDPVILLDGAHNEQACLALRDGLGRLVGAKPVIFVIGLLEDKEHRKMLEALLLDAPYRIRSVIGTEPTDPRSYGADRLAAEARDILGDDHPVEVISRARPQEALTLAIQKAKEEGAVICVAGSLYLAGEIRPITRAFQAGES